MYNLYINFLKKWRWNNIDADKLKNILLNQYSDLIKSVDENIYNNLRWDLIVDFNDSVQSLVYKHNGKRFITIIKINDKSK